MLTFCTCEVFLRTLVSGDANLTTVTHVIVVSINAAASQRFWKTPSLEY